MYIICNKYARYISTIWDGWTEFEHCQLIFWAICREILLLPVKHPPYPRCPTECQSRCFESSVLKVNTLHSPRKRDNFKKTQFKFYIMGTCNQSNQTKSKVDFICGPWAALVQCQKLWWKHQHTVTRRISIGSLLNGKSTLERGWMGSQH